MFCCVLSGVACAGGERAAQPACLQLEEVRRFGHVEPQTADLNAHEIAAGGGVLGDIRGAIAGPDSIVYVLDRYSQKIVGFRPDGTVERIIFGGEGQGPGEFITPIDITRTRLGFSVLDWELQRISVFSWSGELRGTYRVESRSGWRHLIRGDTVWIGYASTGEATGPVVYRFTLAGTVLEPDPGLSVEHRPFGTSLGLAEGSDGDILVTTARPGVWMAYEANDWSTRGLPLFPEDTPPVTEAIDAGVIRVTPARHTAAGIGAIGDSVVIQGIFSLDRPFDWADPPGRDDGRSALGVFTAAGDHLATLELPAGYSTAFLKTEPESGRIFLHATEPFPQVVEYHLTGCRAR